MHGSADAFDVTTCRFHQDASVAVLAMTNVIGTAASA